MPALPGTSQGCGHIHKWLHTESLKVDSIILHESYWVQRWEVRGR